MDPGSFACWSRDSGQTIWSLFSSSVRWGWVVHTSYLVMQVISIGYLWYEPALNVGDPGSIPGTGRSPGEGNGYPLHYSCLENSMDRRAWGGGVHIVHGVTNSWTWLSDFDILVLWFFFFNDLLFANICKFKSWVSKMS